MGCTTGDRRPGNWVRRSYSAASTPRWARGKLFNLKLLEAGDLIHVTSAGGVVTTFVVNRVVEYAKCTFPDWLVYGSHGTIAPQLVTCGGAFDHSNGHYTANIVVFSTLASSTPPSATQ